jgi:hypothetical protein
MAEHYVWLDEDGEIRSNRFMGNFQPEAIDTLIGCDTSTAMFATCEFGRKVRDLTAARVREHADITIEKQAEIIRAKNAIIEQLETKYTEQTATLLREEQRSTWLETVLRYIMYKLSLISIVHGSHRVRDAELRAMVRDINFKMTLWSQPPQDMDDIPF